MAECRLPRTIGPEFYVIELVSTRRIPGSGAATGRVDVTFAPSPFGVSLTENGDYLRDLEINVSNLRPPEQGALVVWVTTPQLDRIERVGRFGRRRSPGAGSLEQVSCRRVARTGRHLHRPRVGRPDRTPWHVPKRGDAHVCRPWAVRD